MNGARLARVRLAGARLAGARLAGVGALAFLLHAPLAHAGGGVSAPPEPPSPPRRLHPFAHLGPNLEKVFLRPSGYVPLAAAGVATAFLSASEGDHLLRVSWAQLYGEGPFTDVAVVAGYVAPLAVVASLYTIGFAAGQDDLLAAGSATLQAAAIACGTTALLKMATGRPFPLHGGDPAAPDRYQHPEYAKEWNPFRPDLGVAFPSGHAACAFATAAAVTASLPEAPWLIAVAYPAAGAIAFGMLAGDHHWSSDVLFGVVLGEVVGRVVGRSFAPQSEVPMAVVPWPSGNGLAVHGVF